MTNSALSPEVLDAARKHGEQINKTTKPFVYDIGAEARSLATGGPTTLSSDKKNNEQEEYKKLSRLAEQTGFAPNTYPAFIAELGKASDPVLGRFAYHAMHLANQPGQKLLADVTVFGFKGREVKFIDEKGTERPLVSDGKTTGILESGMKVGNKDYDIAAWSAYDIKNYQSIADSLKPHGKQKTFTSSQEIDH